MVAIQKIAAVPVCIALCVVVSACSEKARSVEYFKAHEREAREAVAKCSEDASASAEDCKNAAEAVSHFDAKALHRKAFGDPPKQPKVGYGY
jgi:uncharacterized MAPEG superfamily protein